MLEIETLYCGLNSREGFKVNKCCLEVEECRIRAFRLCLQLEPDAAGRVFVLDKVLPLFTGVKIGPVS